MKSPMDQYNELRKKAFHVLHAQRILSEIGFLMELSRAKNGCYDGLLHPQLQKLYDAWREEGVIPKQAAAEAEAALMSLQTEAKSYHLTCAAHAHIDMNWMWGFNETVSVTVDTFRTILNLMEEYPEFTFSQSQASVYRIIEEYYPQMLSEIRRRVQEGRWEVTASSWVENDKNMSGTEAMIRHLLYTKRYLSGLLGISADGVRLDFEPDTFGHSESLPEILAAGGVSYYYHCRGYEGKNIYHWQAPSGAKVLVYREPAWYNETIEYDLCGLMPAFCETYHTHQMLKVYGVGDHGGGPTRRDIERLREMASWPLLPEIHFGTIQGFFEALSQDQDSFDTVRQELNYVFTGCYTSQSRIKRANRLGEDRLYDAEALDVQAGLLDSAYRTAGAFEPAWRRVLFNQFHDILPGSGVIETREFAMGEFQKALATAGVNANHAMNTVCTRLDGSALLEEADLAEEIAPGAGVGYGVGDDSGYRFTQTERGLGNVRLYTLFNSTQYPREELAELTLWDWQGEPDQICVSDAKGNPVESQLAAAGSHYWGHQYQKLLIKAKVPPMGYAAYVVKNGPARRLKLPPHDDPRCDYITNEPLVLENQQIRAVFSPVTMQLLSLRRAGDETELIRPDAPAGSFLYILEETMDGMTAWRVGRYAMVKNLNETAGVFLDELRLEGLRKWIRYHITFEGSRLDVTVSLDDGGSMIRYEVKADWHETGIPQKNVPQLSFSLPLAGENASFRCAVPMGFVDRPALSQDVPCTGLIAALPKKGTAVALLADCKYGFRGEKEGLAVDLLRSSYEPDPYPEYGIHYMTLGVAAIPGDKALLAACSAAFQHPLYACAAAVKKGSLPLEQSLVQIEGAQLSGIKRAEEGEGLILHLYSLSDEKAPVSVTLPMPVRSAAAVDLLERTLGSAAAEGNTVRTEIPARGLLSLRVEL